MAKNEAKIRFTAETSGFNAEIKKSNSQMAQLRSELKLNEAEMKTNGVSIEGLEQKHNLLQAQLKTSKNQTEALSQKVEKAAQIFGEDSEEVVKLRTQLLNAQTAQEKIKQAINSCNSEIDEQKRTMKETSDASGDMDKELSNVGEATGKAAEGFTILKGAMADLLADGIKKVAEGLADIGTEAFTMANDITSATNTFIAKTGESKDSADEFEDVMVDIYNGNYGESFDDIAEAMSTVKSTLGDLDDNELKAITTDALVLRDTFDMDVNESLRAVNSLMDQFGITSDDAFDLIAQGAQNGLNQNGDLLDVINEYSVQFESAGYSAEDMFNMLSNGVDAGTWSVDKLGDAVKEMNIRLSDGTADEALTQLGLGLDDVKGKLAAGGESAQEAMGQIMSSIMEVEDEQERYQLGVSIFGTMWEDLGEDAVMALMNTQGEVSLTADALDEINAIKYNDLGSALEGIKRNLQTSVAGPIKEDVMPAVNAFVEDVDWDGVGQIIGDAFGAVVEGAMALVGASMQAVQWMNEHKGVMIALASVIGVVATAITAYNIVQGIKNAMDLAQVTTIWGLVAAHWAQATAAMAALAPYILIVAAIAAVIAIIVLCVQHWDDIVAAVKNCIEKMSEAWKSFTEWLDRSVIKPMLAWFKNLWSGIKNVFSSVGSWFSQKFKSAKDGVMNAWSNVVSKFSSIKNSIVNAFSNIKQKISQPFERARDAVKSVVDKIKGFFSNLKLSLPRIKLPHFSIAGKLSLNPPSVPKLKIDWYKDGGIMTSPTIFGVNGNRLMAGGEAGPEAILPIDRLEGYVAGAIEKTIQTTNMTGLVNAIEDLADRAIELKINGRHFATATASDADNVNGLRSSFINRGLVIE